MNKKVIIAVVVVAFLAALAIGGYFFWVNSKTTPAQDLAKEATGGVLPSLNTNPLENKPDLNPADKANPFKNVETNPFK